VYQANTLLEQVGQNVKIVLLDTFRALAGVIVILVQKARKRRAEVHVRLVMQDKQIRTKVRNLAGNVRKENIPQVLVRIIAHRVAQEHIKTKQVKQLVKNVKQDPTNHK
jgi:hypothetical protein